MSFLRRLQLSVSRALGLEARRQRRDRGLLLRLCLGDEAAADRLIEGERSRTGVSEAEACRRAIRRLRYDNR